MRTEVCEVRKDKILLVCVQRGVNRFAKMKENMYCSDLRALGVSGGEINSIICQAMCEKNPGKFHLYYTKYLSGLHIPEKTRRQCVKITFSIYLSVIWLSVLKMT